LQNITDYIYEQSMKKTGNLKQVYLLIFIIVLAVVLRLININQSLWLDEAISFQAVTEYSLKNLITDFLSKDFNPPLYYLILFFWLKIVPNSEFFIRIPSLVFGVLSCLFVYKIYKFLFKNRKGAFWASLLLATSSLHIYYSQEARAYSLSAFLAILSIYYFLKVINNENIIFIIYYLLFSVLMLYSHYTTWLIFPSQWFYFLISRKWEQKKSAVKLLISNILIFLLFVPFLPVFLKQIKVGQKVSSNNQAWAGALGKATFKNFLLFPVKFLIGRTSFASQIVYGLVVLCLGLFFGYLFWKFYHCQRQESGSRLKYLLLFSWLLIPPALGFLISFKIPLFLYFRFLFCLPAFFIIVSAMISKMKRKKMLFIIVLLINLFFSFKYLFVPKFHRENWKQAVEVLHRRNQGSPVIIFKNASAPFHYYDDYKSELVYTKDKFLVTHQTDIWFIPYCQPIFDPKDLTRKFFINKGFIRVYQKHFNGVTLEKWQKSLS